MYQENEKKEYCKPEMEVVAFSQQGSLLQDGSPCVDEQCYESYTG